MTKKFDEVYEEVMLEYQLDEGFGLFFKNKAYHWFLYLIVYYIQETYPNKSEQLNALKRIRFNIIKKKYLGAKQIADIINQEHDININEKDIINVFNNLIKQKIDIYKIHLKLKDKLSQEFTDEKYKKMSDDIIKIFNSTYVR